MAQRIVFTDGTTFACPDTPGAPTQRAPTRERDWRQITVIGVYATIAAAFIDDVSYQREWDSETITDGETTTETVVEDMSAYCIAGQLVDLRDGTFAVYMGKKTEAEKLQEALDAAVLAALGG